MISDEEYLERLVAGIQSVATRDTFTAVNWNEKISGRQFDVVVRFEMALVRYLVLIEVKNHTRKTEARDIEAFITKAGDKHANKIIFVNRAGYQREALEVARRHGVELFSISFDAERSGLSTTAPYLLPLKEERKNRSSSNSINRRTGAHQCRGQSGISLCGGKAVRSSIRTFADDVLYETHKMR